MGVEFGAGIRRATQSEAEFRMRRKAVSQGQCELGCGTLRLMLRVFAILGSALVLTGCGSHVERDAPILLFDGRGTSPNDVAAVEQILRDSHLDYATVDSWRLNAMSEMELRAHRLLIVPGGNFIVIGKSLNWSTTASIRNAVQGGLNYLGICAGAFLGGDGNYNGLNLTSGVKFGFYSAESRGVRKTAVPILDAGGGTLDQYWEDGPELTGWGSVVAKYPDGAPAVVEGASGNGWVVLSGVHPEAPANWRRGLTFTTPVEADHAYAAKLMDAALNRTSLPHF